MSTSTAPHDETDPKSRPLNPLVNPLLTDLYAITMAYAHWRNGRHRETATYELFFRRNPFGGEYTVFAGLEECVKLLHAFRFTDEQIEFLKTQVHLQHADPAFWPWLRSVDCSSVKVTAVREGTIVFPRIPLLLVEGPLAVCQLLETPLLNAINFPSLVATNATRFRQAAGADKMLIEFGLRRAQGPDGGVSASRYAYMGGFDYSSNVLAGQLCGVPLNGTMAHAFVQSFQGRADLQSATLLSPPPEEAEAPLADNVFALRAELGWLNTHEGELCAFIAYAQAFPSSFLCLVDTYDAIKSGVRNFLLVALALLRIGYRPIGIRIDSGDISYLSKVARAEFGDFSVRMGVNFRRLMIVASNDINEPTLLSLRQQGHEVDAFGVGTHLVTCQAQPALGCVYKLVLVNEKPRIKLSQEVEKMTIPGCKRAFRLHNSAGAPVVDLLQHMEEPPPLPGQRILCRHPFQESKRAYVTPSRVEPLHTVVWDGAFTAAYRPPFLDLAALRAFVMEQVARLREDHMRPINPTPYKVSVTNELYTRLHAAWLEESPILEIN